jgi:hypothetical protein
MKLTLVNRILSSNHLLGCRVYLSLLNCNKISILIKRAEKKMEKFSLLSHLYPGLFNTMWSYLVCNSVRFNNENVTTVIAIT